MHFGTLVNRPAGLIISSLGSFAFLMLNRISDIGNKGRLHLPPSKTRKSNFWWMLKAFICIIWVFPFQKITSVWQPYTQNNDPLFCHCFSFVVRSLLVSLTLTTPPGWFISAFPPSLLSPLTLIINDFYVLRVKPLNRFFAHYLFSSN